MRHHGRWLLFIWFWILMAKSWILNHTACFVCFLVICWIVHWSHRPCLQLVAAVPKNVAVIHGPGELGSHVRDGVIGVAKTTLDIDRMCVLLLYYVLEDFLYSQWCPQHWGNRNIKKILVFSRQFAVSFGEGCTIHCSVTCNIPHGVADG